MVPNADDMGVRTHDNNFHSNDCSQQLSNLNSIFRFTSPFVNLSLAFSGIGYILVDMNAMFENTVKLFSLDLAQLPTKVLVQHFLFYHDNLVEEFSDVRYFYEYRNEYEDIVSQYLRKLRKDIVILRSINLLDRIAAVVTTHGRVSFTVFCLRNDLYVCMLDTLIFNYPHVSSHVFHKDTVDTEMLFSLENIGDYSSFFIKVDEADSPESMEELIGRYSSESMEINNRLFLDGSMEFMYENASFKFTREEVCCFKRTDYFVDGFILHKKVIFQEAKAKTLKNAKHTISFDLINRIPYTSNILELLMPPIPEKLSVKHLQNITKSAKSMYDGKFQYATISPVSENKSNRNGTKSSLIKEENEKRLKNEKKRKDDLWLSNFFKNFSKLRDLKSKKSMLESITINNDYINDKLLLLKIEVYSDIWNVELKKEECDESKLVPLYLQCLQYFDKEDTSAFNSAEVDFVLSNLIESGFTATAKELINKFGIFSSNSTLLEKYENYSAKPSDIDLYFQLKYAGEHLKRTLRSKKDKRVPFDPDGWQIELLDAVDERSSVVISAPTSSGKTFICFYVVEAVLLENLQVHSSKLKRGKKKISSPSENSNLEDSFCFTVTEKSPTYPFRPNCSIVIFCLPTKALANQVSADVYARFKPQKHNLQGTLMNDKCNEPFNSQVLITIPSMLETVLSEIRRINNDITANWIRYIIIDEVHKINDRDLGVKMERVIHQANCPILLLSATIGNIDEFYGWFKRIENKKGRVCKLVKHDERFCELKTYVYTNNELKNSLDNSETRLLNSYHFGEIPITGKITPLNCMFAYTHSHLKNFGFGNDLNFLPEELLSIYYYIYIVLRDDQKALIKHLAPRKFFKSNIICKSDVKLYEKHILNTFEKWVQMNVLDEEQVKEVYRLLTEEANLAFDSFDFITNVGNKSNSSSETTDDSSDKISPVSVGQSFVTYDIDKITNNLFDLLNNLSNDNLLPVIIFNTDRDVVNKLAKSLFSKITKLDKIKQKDKSIERLKKEQKRIRDVKLSKDAWMEEDDNVIVEEDDIKFNYLDKITKLTDYEVEDEFRNIYSSNVGMILNMAKRGIGLHHDALNRRIKSATEILFRKKHIRVLFATETLALGINMPCRTVVFCGDSLTLDPMNYKQMSGRAGRRGYDTLGHVVFMNISKYRVQNLLVSMLPQVKGSYIYSNTSFVGFNIGQSILSNPLLGITIKDDAENKLSVDALNTARNNNLEQISDYESPIDSISKRMSKLRMDEGSAAGNILSSYSVGDIFMKNHLQRKKILEYQIEKYKSIHYDTYLWDLYVSNRDSDPGVFIFGLLMDRGLVDYSGESFIITIAHLFEVIPLYNAMKYSRSSIQLGELDPKIKIFLDSINSEYIFDLNCFLPTHVKNIQNKCITPLFQINSLLYFPDYPKNSYIYDFYHHGSNVKIKHNNGIDGGELWQRLYKVDSLMKGIIQVLEKQLEYYSEKQLEYYSEKQNSEKMSEIEKDLKAIKMTYSVFDTKFKAIYA